MHFIVAITFVVDLAAESPPKRYKLFGCICLLVAVEYSFLGDDEIPKSPFHPVGLASAHFGIAATTLLIHFHALDFVILEVGELKKFPEEFFGVNILLLSQKFGPSTEKFRKRH